MNFSYAHPTPCPFCLFFSAAPAAYGGSQARGWIRASAASLHHSHSNSGSLTHCVRPGIKPSASWFLVRFISAAPRWEHHFLAYKLKIYMCMCVCIYIYFFFFFFFRFGGTYGMQKFPGQGLNLHCSSDPWPKPQQWRCWTLNLLSHQGTPWFSKSGWISEFPSWLSGNKSD